MNSIAARISASLSAGWRPWRHSTLPSAPIAQRVHACWMRGAQAALAPGAASQRPIARGRQNKFCRTQPCRPRQRVSHRGSGLASWGSGGRRRSSGLRSRGGRLCRRLGRGGLLELAAGLVRHVNDGALEFHIGQRGIAAARRHAPFPLIEVAIIDLGLALMRGAQSLGSPSFGALATPA